MALELSNVYKHFGPVRANDGISLTVEEGTLHGLLGENGAGKSTLMKIVSGFVEADSGEISLDGHELELRSPKDAIQAGIGMLHQDPLVFLPFTVLDNFLVETPGSVVIDRKAGLAELDRMSGELGFSFNPDQLARRLTVGERQQLEITRLLWLGAKVLIFDEPTTGISATQRAQLFDTLRKLAAEGLIVIFVTHKLEEAEQLCHSVTVMRQGRVVGEADMPVAPAELVEMMFGRMISEPERSEVPIGGSQLGIRDAAIRSGSTDIEGLGLDVASAEVIGLAGLEGSGQRAFLEACSGLLELSAGTISLGGADITKDGYRARLSSGIHYLPAGRLEEGLVSGLTITEHFALTTADQGFIVDWDVSRERAEEKIQEYHIKGTPESTAESLSGGNQQRLLLAMMPDDIRVLLMEHPTRGLDVESADYLWTKMLERRGDGTSIVFASADLDELLRYSDRIVVFFSGAVFKIVHAAATDGEELGYLIGGRERA